jgi:RND family efflux transporter MFP subunit
MFQTKRQKGKIQGRGRRRCRLPWYAPLRWGTVVTTAVVATLFLLIFPDEPGAQASKKSGGRPPALVKVLPVVEKEVVTRVTLVGTAEPRSETVVASEEAGLVRKMLVDEGDWVKMNQTLCVQDATQLTLRIEAARAALAEAEVMQARVQREWERQKRLFAINSVSKKAYENAQFDVGTASKKVARLQAEFYTLLDQVKKKTIYSPVSGYVVERHTLKGQWLGKGAPVVTLAVLDPIRVMVPVPERYISGVRKGEAVKVTFDALPEHRFKGVIKAVIPRADKASRAFPVRIEISNPKGVIKAGMLGRATMPVGRLHKAILIPKDALVLSIAGKSVYVINDQSAHLVPVKIGPAHGALIEVRGDLKAGQRVVVRGNERLRPGQRVKIMYEDKPKVQHPRSKMQRTK